MKKSLLFMAALSVATFFASAQDALPEGEVYIRNVKTGFYLNNGYSWGTKAILKPQARAFQLVENSAGDGTVYLKNSMGVIARDGATSGELYCLRSRTTATIQSTSAAGISALKLRIR